MEDLQREFVPYELAVKLKELGFNEPCVAIFNINNELNIDDGFYKQEDYHKDTVLAPTFSQAINFLYICSNKQIDIELKASDTYEERLRKIDQGCEDLWNLQNSKSN